MKVLLDFQYSYNAVIELDDLQQLIEILSKQPFSWNKVYVNGQYVVKLTKKDELPSIEFISEDKYNVAKFVNQSEDE